MPEEFAFEKLLGDGPAVDRDVVPFRALYSWMALATRSFARTCLAVNDDVSVRFGSLEDEAVYPPHGLAFADDVPQPVEIADGSLELAVFFLELKLLELLFADVHHQPFEVAQFAVGVENPSP